MEEPGGLQSMGSLRVGHDWATSLSCVGEGNGNPLQCSCLENPRDGEPGGLMSVGSHRVGHDWSDLAAAAAAARWHVTTYTWVYTHTHTHTHTHIHTFIRSCWGMTQNKQNLRRFNPWKKYEKRFQLRPFAWKTDYGVWIVPKWAWKRPLNYMEAHQGHILKVNTASQGWGYT